MKILLVHPSYPITYWGFQYALRYSGAKAMLPPLGLVTLAALLPAEWDMRLVDLNIESLPDATLAWADAVLIGGMRVQADSMHEVTARAHALGKTVVVGGPAPTTSPGEYADADVVFQGEAEGRVPSLVSAIVEAVAEADRQGARTPRVLSAEGLPSPAMTTSPTPRFELLQLARYDTMSIQTSRGCPYRCEFCDIIEIFGRVPRIKSAEQVIGEMEALRLLGWRGAIFVVDDNFIGNRPAVRKLLPKLTAYQAERGHPFDLSTEASINLASDEPLVTAMVEAGFSGIFVGIESPDAASLQGTQKTQNLRMDLLEAVNSLSKAGLEVMAGFIVGFDEDGPAIFEAQRAFIQSTPIPIAMAGLLMALPQTQLWRRLDREGRLRTTTNGDQFGRPNFVPTLDEATLVKGYAQLLSDLYQPKAYFERVQRQALLGGKTPGHARVKLSDVWKLVKVMFMLGIVRSWRGHFWKLLFKTARKAPHNLRRAVVLAAMGDHMIRYTKEDVLPRLAEALGDIEREASPERARALPIVSDDGAIAAPALSA
ncbi:MAG: DUF4070 domain-containing protein [Myxococcota bacterium]